ncbi:3-dehydroquinate synthase [Paramagnetospirillum kuznetsovii]|uniref:3-dehydroquinate synthase n=1 Tax=Paramagnetospirillum kuznetsovii TaxID=2053833 RepID=A0A364NY87_9PROT|nr:3-dehydroquinate synthase [Paramagnetospirillum kuznetsovii]RAU21960.1 3-dehydroquinate synthase [Paramagnetospirillum kuznetsovii]
MTTVVPVDLGERSYDIHIGSGLLDRAGELIQPLMRGNRALVITDDQVAPLYLERVEKSLVAAGIMPMHTVLPAGEKTKDFPHLEALLDAMLAARAERGTMVVALGGGVIGDLTGFAASILLRGVDFVQIPTTLLAQVDSSVGGKTGINTRHGKNLVGAFHQPRLVLADISALQTLPRRQMLAGYAEVVKYGIIDDAPFFAWLETNGAAVVAGDPDALAQAVAVSCRAKARIVAADEREGGVRALLNLGHTFGHALEAETGFSDEMLHGEAVAIGMVMALRLSSQIGLAPAEDCERLKRHLDAMGLSSALPASGRLWEVSRLLDHMRGDKKVKDGKVTFVMARGIGQSFLTRDVPEDALAAMLAEMAAGR